MIFASLNKTDIGYLFVNVLNGWRGIKVTGSSSDLGFYGGTYEGQNGTTERAPGTVLRLEGGSGSFHGTHMGQAMSAPDAAEGGYVHITGGEWNFYSPHFYRGSTADTVPCIYQSGGRLLVMGATYRLSETWAARPRLETSAPASPNAGTYSTYCPDLSMNIT